MVVAEVRLYREGLAQALHARDGMTVVGTVADANVVCDRAIELRPDVIVFDTAINGAMRIFRDLSRLDPRPHIVALGVREDEDDIAACAAAGVAGFVAREGSFEELLQTIAAVMRGEAACSAPILATLLRRIAVLAPIQGQADPSLTAREREILALIADDLSNKEIAARLSVDVSTVKNHVHNLLDKMKVHRRSEAAAQARRMRTQPIQFA